MSISRALLFSLSFAASALAQTTPAPVIQSIAPASGPSGGGNQVTIAGTHLGLPPNFACLLPCPAKVTFDGVPARLDQETDTALVVTTPSHAPGVVDVKVVTGDNRNTTAPGGFLYVDASAPLISSITPAIGPSTGGTLVTIAGSRLGVPPDVACLLPCAAKVTFGEAAATVVQESDTALIVKTPAHETGGVDVKVVTGDGRIAIARGGFLYADTVESTYERVLLPIYLEGRVPGSNGTSWATDLWLRNNGPNGLTLAPWPCPRGALCIPVFPLTRTLQPGETLHNLPEIAQINPGRVLFVSKDGAADFSAGLRLYEVSHFAVDAGTEIPVVRESQLLSRTAHLHNVPLNGLFRIMLRIYDLAGEESRFRVRVYEEAAGVSGGSPLADLELKVTSTETGTFRFHPAYAEYGALGDLLAQLNPPAALRIDVEPLTSGSRYWAFVSITNNDTQRVTVITPH